MTRRLALFLTLVASACTPPEARTARRFLACVADHDLHCLRRLHAPLLARLRAWSSALGLDPLRVGPYTRHAMQDSDNPFWTIAPVECAKRAARGAPERELLRDLDSCRCETREAIPLAPAEARAQTFEPERVKAVKIHPALEILANRSTAEAKRVHTLWRVACTCGERPVEVLVLDYEGRDPPLRVFRVSGVCGPPEPEVLRTDLARAQRLLSGELH